MPARRHHAGAEAVVEHAADGRQQAQHHRHDRQPQAGRKRGVLVDADQDEGDEEEHAEQRGVRTGSSRGCRSGRRAGAEREVDQRRRRPVARRGRTAPEGRSPAPRSRSRPATSRPRHGLRSARATTAVSAGAIRSAPRQSKRPPSGRCLVCGMHEPAEDRPSRPNGTLIQNAQCQPSVSSTRPPTAGPTPSPIACAADCRPSARPRCFGSRGEDDDGDAVGGDQRGADALQDAEGDQRRQDPARSRTGPSRGRTAGSRRCRAACGRSCRPAGRRSA